MITIWQINLKTIEEVNFIILKALISGQGCFIWHLQIDFNHEHWSCFQSISMASKCVLSRSLKLLSKPTLREISGTCWLTWVSLAIVSRLSRIIRSIDQTVENFQVNDPDLCEIRGDENHNLPPACYSIYCTIPLRSVRLNLHYYIAFWWKFVLFSIHITLLHCYVCSVHISIVL